MSTTADEKLYHAADHVRQAIACLTEIAINQCDGYRDYMDDDGIHHSLIQLIGIAKQLTR